MKNEIEQKIFENMKAKDFGESMCNETKLNVLKWTMKQLRIGVVSNSEVFEHYGKPFTSGRDLWDFLTAHYNFTPKT